MPKVVPEYKEEARKKILASGRDVMGSKGYQATTMDDIARHVGVSKAALYQYFGSKDELVIEIVKAFPEQIREKKMAKSPLETPLDAWIAILDFYLDNNAEQNALFFELLSMIPRNPEIAKSFSENMLAGLEKATLGVAHYQQQGGGGTGADPRTIALATMSVFHGLRALSLIGIERDELRGRWIEIGKILLGCTADPLNGAGIEKGRAKAGRPAPD